MGSFIVANKIIIRLVHQEPSGATCRAWRSGQTRFACLRGHRPIPASRTSGAARSGGLAMNDHLQAALDEALAIAATARRREQIIDGLHLFEFPTRPLLFISAPKNATREQIAHQ